jgi:hypothetical protein
MYIRFDICTLQLLVGSVVIDVELDKDDHSSISQLQLGMEPEPLSVR